MILQKKYHQNKYNFFYPICHPTSSQRQNIIAVGLKWSLQDRLILSNWKLTESKTSEVQRFSQDSFL